MLVSQLQTGGRLGWAHCVILDHNGHVGGECSPFEVIPIVVLAKGTDLGGRQDRRVGVEVLGSPRGVRQRRPEEKCGFQSTV